MTKPRRKPLRWSTTIPGEEEALRRDGFTLATVGKSCPGAWRWTTFTVPPQGGTCSYSEAKREARLAVQEWDRQELERQRRTDAAFEKWLARQAVPTTKTMSVEWALNLARAAYRTGSESRAGDLESLSLGERYTDERDPDRGSVQG